MLFFFFLNLIKKLFFVVFILFHLATQIKSVAQFKISPTNTQNFDIVVDGDLLIKQGEFDIGKY